MEASSIPRTAILPKNSQTYWQLPVTILQGVGPVIAAKLMSLGIHSIGDLWFHLPLRFEDRSSITPIASLEVGQIAFVQGCVTHCRMSVGAKRNMVVDILDKTGHLRLRFFHFSKTQSAAYQKGRLLRAYGEVRLVSESLEMAHPSVEWIVEEDHPLNETLTPIYPTVAGISQAKWIALFKQLLQKLDRDAMVDRLPEALRLKWRLPDIASSLKDVHAPPLAVSLNQWQNAQTPGLQRLVFEELLAHHLSMLKRRDRVRQSPTLACPPTPKTRQLLDTLPFALTVAQQRVVDEIACDLASEHSMQRLLQGDVGSGKTVVAMLAAIQVVDAGGQVAIMAPTEILAEQHHAQFSRWLQPLGIQIGWVAGSQKGGKRKKALQAIAKGSDHIVIGTHALFEPEVVFNRLALVVVDEQHRFGVYQRLTLKKKAFLGMEPHQLIMTATPIPRTLAMSLYADLDTSVIDQRPPGRKPVKTIVLSNSKRDELIQRVERVVLDGRQVYWVCTTIEESEILNTQPVQACAEHLIQQLPHRRISVMHGRMHARDKAEVMRQFTSREIDILVTTTVIEVGVDVPNATLMVIENPERFGLAQLHQLRGRVGRGDAESFCVLLYQHPLSAVAKARLDVMRDTDDGFLIAEQDLEIRGPGEVLGVRQTGEVGLKIADLTRDKLWIEPVKEAAQFIRNYHPHLVDPIIMDWLGTKEQFADV